MSANIVSLAEYSAAKAVPLWKHEGYRHLHLWTTRETKKWRALAREHEAARRRINAVLDDKGPAYEVALTEYRNACIQVLGYGATKPRHLPFLIRCAAEVLGHDDPAWLRSNSQSRHPLSYEECIFAALYWHVHKAKIEERPLAKGSAR